MMMTRVAGGVQIAAPAKLNLFLEVLARRADGFHEIETLMVAIGIQDRLCFQPTQAGRISVEWSAAEGVTARERAVDGRQALSGSLPSDDENLVTVAVERLRQAAGVEQGARIRLLKRIPAAAGLGGASSDAAAALIAANQAWQLQWDLQQLSALAASIGSDVPFFLNPTAAVCRGRGERIEEIKIRHPLFVVVVRPPAGLRTAAVYQNCQPAEPPLSAKPLVAALQRGDLKQVGQLMSNRLQPAATRLSPWIRRLQNAFHHLDCCGHQMTGSGTSYFGICRHRYHARRVAACVRGRGFGYVRVASTFARSGKTQLASSQP